MADSLNGSDLLTARRIARFGYIILFVLVANSTPAFEQFPPLKWIAIAGLVVVFFDAIVCARRRWRTVKQEMRGDDAEPN